MSEGMNRCLGLLSLYKQQGEDSTPNEILRTSSLAYIIEVVL